MTVEEPTRIDIHAFDPKQQRVYVVIADHLGWDEDEEEHHLLCLNEKIQNYLYFLTSGQLEEHKPQWKGFPVTIRVMAPLLREARLQPRRQMQHATMGGFTTGLAHAVWASMSIDQPTVVDFLWKDERHKRAVLTISDHLDWEEGGEHLLLLQDKLNHYLEFIESGQLMEAKPEFKGLPVLIHVAAQHPLSAQAAKFYEMAKERAADFGCSLEFDLGAKLLE